MHCASWLKMAVRNLQHDGIVPEYDVGEVFQERSTQLCIVWILDMAGQLHWTPK